MFRLNRMLPSGGQFWGGVLVSGMAAWGAWGADPAFDRGAVLVFNEENDLFVNTDRHYTQGIKFAYLHEDGHMPLGMAKVNSWLPDWGYRPLTGRSGYSIGQNMYTPADLGSRDRIPTDRPYAGWLYVGWLLQRQGVTPGRAIPVQESFELELGTMGPSSLARQAQTWIHQLRGFDLPQGWANQLHAEPGFRLKYERAWRFHLGEPSRPLGAEFIPWGGFAAGTIEDTLRSGGIARVGWNLPDDFGVRTIDSLSTTGGGVSKGSPSHWGGYVFAGVEGRWVGRNGFLDGNLSGHSQSVRREWLVGDALIGFNLVFHHLEVGYTHVFRSPEFDAQTEYNEFGSVYAKIRF